MKAKMLWSGAMYMFAAGALASDDQGYRKLSGSYAITSAHLVDPGPAQKRDRAVFFVESDAAKDLYQAMKGKAVRDPCSDELTTKTAGGLACSKEVGREVYTCAFGVRLESGTLIGAKVC
ncbi:hypothetical protein K4L06_14470 [Lysobacter sp. BMK333-48F3]|uniref:hypothetical protein n=1 Tax=Lysobacter sp. BMK333-48F3 TaxID=2867962 RepID=UPI001C8C3D31|nr:hypothetical protein [Lysobacter sp. BMK333-48F3]MBX9402514.1 hypothetical protein [Lysobacter sp. BMK333-48F3]